MKKQIRNLIYIKATFLFALLIAFNSSCYAFTRTAIASGNWTNGAIWVPGGVPLPIDDIIINAGVTVTYDIDIFIIPGGSVTINGSLVCGEDTFIVDCGCLFTVNSGGIMTGRYIRVADGSINGNGWVFANLAFIIDTCSNGFFGFSNHTIGSGGCGPTGIIKNKLQNILTLHPNPFNDKLDIAFTVSKPTDLTYEIFDMYGKKLKTYSHHNFAGEFKQSETFENLSTGVYFFQLTLDGERTVKKIVKE